MSLPLVVKAGGKPIDQPNCSIRRLEKQRARIRCHRTGIKRGFHSPPLEASKIKAFCDTLCRHRGSPLNPQKSLWHNDFR